MAEYIKREDVIWITAETGALETQGRVIDLPAADVRDKSEVENLVDEAIRILNAIKSSGRMDYGDYCELYDAISDIYGTTGGAV
jgi:hypothetical protein